MLICAFDLETTGLDKMNDNAIEVGLALYSTGLHRTLELHQFQVQTTKPISQEITDVTGLVKPALDRFGYDENDAFDMITSFFGEADVITTHNGRRFDMPFAGNWANRLARELPNKLLIDTFTDIPGMAGESLITMCAKKGILLVDAHSALTDAIGSLRLVIHHDHTVEQVIERAKSPNVVVQGLQKRNDNSLAKRQKFRWAPDPHKIWWKTVKEMDLANFNPGFDWRVLDIQPEELDND